MSLSNCSSPSAKTEQATEVSKFLINNKDTKHQGQMQNSFHDKNSALIQQQLKRRSTLSVGGSTASNISALVSSLSSNHSYCYNPPTSEKKKELELLKHGLNLSQSDKTEQIYALIDDYFERNKIKTLQNLRNNLSIDQYNCLIDQMSLVHFQEHDIVSFGGKQLQSQFEQEKNLFILLDGLVVYYDVTSPNAGTGNSPSSSFASSSRNPVHSQPTRLSAVKQSRKTLQMLAECTSEIYPMTSAEVGELLTPINIGNCANTQTSTSFALNVTYTSVCHSSAYCLKIPLSHLSKQSHLAPKSAPSQELQQVRKSVSRQIEEYCYQMSHSSLFKGLTVQNLRKIYSYLFEKNFHKYGDFIYKQGESINFVYFILEGQVELFKDNLHCHEGQPIVKLSKLEIFGLDQHFCKDEPQYLFSAKVCSQKVKVISIHKKSLIHLQSEFPCISENMDFYLKRAVAMHSKIYEKNYRIMENKENILNKQNKPKKKARRNKKKKQFPSSMEWWGLAQNAVGSKKYKLDVPLFEKMKFDKENNSSKLNSASQGDLKGKASSQSNGLLLNHKIEQIRRKIFENDIKDLIQEEAVNFKSEDEVGQSPYKASFMPKINKLKIKMLDVKPKAIDQSEKVKKKLLSYAKNGSSFCDRLDLS